jgi:Zn-finger nucleic acid-binding protein
VSGPYRDFAAPNRPCPRCGFSLGARQVLDARIDECPSCEGIFVDKALVPRFLDPLDLGGEVLSSFPDGSPESLQGGPMYVKCPRCAVVMNRRQFATGAKVIVDICRDHGVWFDADELRAVAAFAEGGGMEKAAEADTRRRARERADAERDQLAERRQVTTHSRWSTAEGQRSLLDLIRDLLR